MPERIRFGVSEYIRRERKKKTILKSVKKALITGALLASGAGGFELGKKSNESHLFDKIPERIEQTSVKLAPNLTLLTRGLSVMVDWKKSPLAFLGDRRMRLTIERQDKEGKDPSLVFDKKGFNNGMYFENSTSGVRIQRFVLRGGPSIPCEITCQNGVCQWYAPLTLSSHPLAQDRSLEHRSIFIRQEALGFVDKHVYHLHDHLYVLSDRPKRGNEKTMIENLRLAANLANTINEFIRSFDTKDRVNPLRPKIEKIFLYEPSDPIFEGPHYLGYRATFRNSMITGPNYELENRPRFLSAILHEASHFAATGIGDREKKKIMDAFDEFRRLGGHDPEVDLRSSPQGEGGPIYSIVDESSIFSLPWQLGHPSENPQELFASLVSCITFAPDRVEERLAKLPRNQQQRFRDRVIRPCLAVFGNEWGPKIMGDSYTRFR